MIDESRNFYHIFLSGFWAESREISCNHGNRIKHSNQKRSYL